MSFGELFGLVAGGGTFFIAETGSGVLFRIMSRTRISGDANVVSSRHVGLAKLRATG